MRLYEPVRQTSSYTWDESQGDLSWIRKNNGDSGERVPPDDTLQIAPLFLYGQYAKAVEMGRAALEHNGAIQSARNMRFTMLFHGLALTGLVWAKAQNAGVSSIVDTNGAQVTTEALEQLKVFLGKMVDWQTGKDVSYLSWSKLLAAQIAELEGNHGSVLQIYEDTADYAAANNLVFEEALSSHLLAGYFIRRGARRSAKFTLRETITLYRKLGATGVAAYLEDEYESLLQSHTRISKPSDERVKEDDTGDSGVALYSNLDGNINGKEEIIASNTKSDRAETSFGRLTPRGDGKRLLDVNLIDLTSILEISQALSSVLDVDQLLEKMCTIIMSRPDRITPTLIAIIVAEGGDGPLNIAVSADLRTEVQSHTPGIPLVGSSLVAENVVHHCMQFQEPVCLADIMRDERFGNVNSEWSSSHLESKGVMALPIRHGESPPFGVVYLEGKPNSFTDRNFTVLSLLVNQIGISYSNALTMKEMEKVSATNIAMVVSHKQALAKARESETKAKLAEAEALRHVQLAEEAAKAKSFFLANVSHELRTPLNGVIGNSELLRDSALSKEQTEMADSIRISADLLLTVINDILDFSKMEADKMELYIVAFVPPEMLREVVRSVSYSNRDKKQRGVEIVQDINLPDILIYGDPVRLHQVIGNLIGNSLKFTEKGTITVGARVDDENSTHIQLHFWVQDTGIGIPPAQLAKLFKPFSQADASTARKYGGSGLGLSICRSLIESMMGGRIELESEEGVGTIAWFTVTFPKATAEVSAGDSLSGSDYRDQPKLSQQAIDLQPRIPYNSFSDVPREKLRICIAEDNEINQKIAMQFVQKLGFNHVDAYDNGYLAVEGLRAKAKEGIPYHLLLCDVQMPICDGYEATRLIRQDPIDAVRNILVIAMTASAIQGDREKCLVSGMNDYLAKPVRMNVLKKKLEHYLQQVS